MRRIDCRGCGRSALRLVHDFGAQPLAGHFPLVPEREARAPKYPLELWACEACTLLQITSLPPIEEVFHADYRYSSSTIPALTRHFDEYGAWLSRQLAPGAKVLEFGCNDGVLLERLAKQGFDCRGVDASLNVVELARAKGLIVDEGFFSSAYVAEAGIVGRFDLVTCSNVYAHVDDLSDVTNAAWQALADSGLFAIEVHDASGLSESCQFETIYHEHLCYFTEGSLSQHLVAHGFRVLKVERTAMHGGALRVLAQKVQPSVRAQAADAGDASWIDALGSALKRGIERASASVGELSTRHETVWGYGAAGRSQMFLNFTGSAPRFEAVFDDSPLRQNRFICGTNLPIERFDSVRRRGCCIILAWNYAPDVSARIADRFDAVYTVLPELRQW